MAATFVRAFYLHFITICVSISLIYCFNPLKVDLDFKESPGLQRCGVSRSFTLKHRFRRPIVSRSPHGLSLLAVPEHYVLLDITINMNIQSQPGPTYASSAEIPCLRAGSRTNSLSSGVSVRGNSRPLDSAKLLFSRYKAFKPSTVVMTELKSLGILRYRGGLEQETQMLYLRKA